MTVKLPVQNTDISLIFLCLVIPKRLDAKKNKTKHRACSSMDVWQAAVPIGAFGLAGE